MMLKKNMKEIGEMELGMVKGLILTYADGLNFYKGGFKNGRRHGKGFVSEMSESGPIISKGTWTNGLWTIRE